MLAHSAPDVALGFDPLLYLDLAIDEPRPAGIPPFRIGAYGLLDDHPLSAFSWGSPGAYFGARAEALLNQVPRGVDWFIRAEVLLMALEADFDWIGYLHQAGSKVAGWTIDLHQEGHLKRAQRLVEHGVDVLTTDTPTQLAEKLAVESIV
jgi:glycerophosphoryl diester phosphodiesterase